MAIQAEISIDLTVALKVTQQLCSQLGVLHLSFAS